MKPRHRLVAIREEEYTKLLHDVEKLSSLSSFTFSMSVINSAIIVGLFIMMIVN